MAGNFASPFTGNVTISDSAASTVTASTLSSIGSATSGTVTVTHSLTITGTNSQLVAALVTPASRVGVTNTNVTNNDGNFEQIDATDITDIHNAIGTGTFTITNSIILNGSASEVELLAFLIALMVQLA